MKYLYIILFAFFLAGCDEGIKSSVYTGIIKKDPELSDCVVKEIWDKYGSYINVVRCPLSVTTTNYRSGKSQKTSVVIDDASIQELQNQIEILKEKENALSKLSTQEKQLLGLK